MPTFEDFFIKFSDFKPPQFVLDKNKTFGLQIQKSF